MRDLRMFVFLWCVFVIFFVAGVVNLRAHGSYPIECCHDRDCAPIDPKKVTRNDDGSFTLTLGPKDHPMLAEAGVKDVREYRVSGNTVRKPLNGDYHVCFSPTGLLLCFFDRDAGI